jgi:hypothetical protein
MNMHGSMTSSDHDDFGLDQSKIMNSDLLLSFRAG